MPKVQVTPRSLWSILSRSRGGVGKVLSPRRRRCLGWDLRKRRLFKQTAELRTIQAKGIACLMTLRWKGARSL